MGKLEKMLVFYERYKGGEYSQNGEAGIINECLKRIGLDKGTAIEFGAPTKTYCSNIFHLPAGWQKIYHDPDPQEGEIIKSYITPDNVNELPKCEVLSIDIDGNDASVWEAYTGRPEVVIIEINSSLVPYVQYFSPSQGASYRTMVELGISKGYFLVCHTGNLIFVLHKYRELFPDIVGDGLSNWEEYFKKDWL